MNVYITGAGFSRGVGYPLSTQLLDEIDHFLACDAMRNASYPSRDWFKFKEWLASQSPEHQHIEFLFTALDAGGTDLDREYRRLLFRALQEYFEINITRISANMAPRNGIT
jgi:hypothetical protein